MLNQLNLISVDTGSSFVRGKIAWNEGELHFHLVNVDIISTQCLSTHTDTHTALAFKLYRSTDYLTFINCTRRRSVWDICFWYISNNSWFFQTQQFIPCFINISYNQERRIISHISHSVPCMEKLSKRKDTQKHE